MSDNGRTHDLAELYRAKDRTRDITQKRIIEKSIALIKQETGAIRSMRESLIRAHRNGDVDEIKDIHDFIVNKSKYKRIND